MNVKVVLLLSIGLVGSEVLAVDWNNLTNQEELGLAIAHAYMCHVERRILKTDIPDSLKVGRTPFHDDNMCDFIDISRIFQSQLESTKDRVGWKHFKAIRDLDRLNAIPPEIIGIAEQRTTSWAALLSKVL